MIILAKERIVVYTTIGGVLIDYRKEYAAFKTK